MPPQLSLADHLLRSLLLLASWTLLGLVGLLGYEHFGGTTPVWPASGLGVALLVLWGPRYWPAISLGSILISLAGGVSPIVYVPLALTNTVEAVGSAWVLRRLGLDPSLSRPREVVLLVIVSVVFCILSAAVGVSVLDNIGAIHRGTALLKGTVWVFGNLLGVLLVAPPLLVWSRPGPARLSAARWAEITALTVVLVAVSLLVFLAKTDESTAMPLAFLTIPFVVAAGMRFGLHGGTLASLLICGLAVVSTANGRGVFVSADMRTSTVLLMMFEGMLVLTALFVGATTADQRRQAGELRQSEAVFHSLAEANRLLLASTDWRECTAKVLITIGHGLRLDRMTLFRRENDPPDGNRMVSVQRWDLSAPDSPARELPSAELVPAQPGLVDWFTELCRGNTVVAQANDPRSENQALLDRFGILSSLAAPIMIDGRCWGFLGLSDCHTLRGWTPQEHAVAQSIATNFGIAIRRDQLRQELADSLTRYRALLSALPDTYILHDRDGVPLDFHAGDCARSWMPPDKLLSRTLEETFPADTAALIRNGFKQVAATGQPVVLEYSLPLPSGATRQHEHRIVQAEGGKFLCIVRDITERREAEAERTRMEHKLRETQRLESLGVLAGGIAHDFNNLLTVIMGNVSLARLTLPAEAPGDPMLKQIEGASLRAADLCRQMLAYAGRGQLVFDQVDLSQLVRDTTSLLQLSLSQRARLEFDFAPQPLPVLVDATQIRQVLMNLITNAAEAMGASGGQVTLTTGLMHADAAYLGACRSSEEVRPGDYCFIEVTDTGCGMSAETLARIFDPFFTTKFTGRGLGLAAVLGIVRGHRGALHVTSLPAKGSVFRVLLPRASAPAAAPAPPPPTPPVPRPRSGLVLIVDDEIPVRLTAATMLQRLGYRTLEAEDGEHGLALFAAQREEIRFVLLDLTMPGMDGQQTLSALRAQRPDLPVIIMSGYDEQEISHRLQGGQAQGFLLKPFTFASLQARLDQAGL